MSMRITNNMVQYGAMNALFNNMEQLDKIYMQMSTLKKIERPSDDPIIAGRSLKLRIDVTEAEQYEQNTKEAMSWMEISDGAISNMEEILKEVKTRLNQASTGALTQEDKEKILSDILQLSEQIKDELNTSYAGRFVFSGHKIDQPVYYDVDTTLAKNITSSIDIQLSEDMKVGINGLTLTSPMVVPKATTLGGTPYAAGEEVPANTIFNPGEVVPKGSFIPKGTVFTAETEIPASTANPDVVGNTADQDIRYEIGVGIELEINETHLSDIFVGNYEKVVDNIVEAVEMDDIERLSALIEDIDKTRSALSERMADGGSRQVRLELTQRKMAEDQVTFTELLSETEDVDIEEIFVEFNAQMMVYQSALKASSQVVMNTLADYI
ncbi:flagellar hook-associated protein FlgL [Candidatus Epulonipiscium viviparus]|uniref:flagellar hook-associated protein FlgL n=1 Tax=Candidatus Epulonipiscium viviparus TaxID=420336 RepID=UPI00016BFB07|nr:flagellar hook-associated protein FlgL [Candidatus Epulopiscium viviparus]